MCSCSSSKIRLRAAKACCSRKRLSVLVQMLLNSCLICSCLCSTDALSVNSSGAPFVPAINVDCSHDYGDSHERWQNGEQSDDRISRIAGEHVQKGRSPLVGNQKS